MAVSRRFLVRLNPRLPADAGILDFLAQAPVGGMSASARALLCVGFSSYLKNPKKLSALRRLHEPHRRGQRLAAV